MQTAFSDQTIKALIEWSLATGGPRGPHITRFRMYRKLANVLTRHDCPDKKVLAVSGSQDFAREVLGLKQAKYTIADYPEYDVLCLPFPDESFDFCVSDQVLEHVEGNPFTAWKELSRVLRPGGFHCHTTCFINQVHAVPKDFWRFTPDALSLLAVSAGCDVLTADGWGNQEAWALINAGFRFAEIPEDQRHPLHRMAMLNDPAWPIHTWIAAQKR